MSLEWRIVPPPPPSPPPTPHPPTQYYASQYCFAHIALPGVSHGWPSVPSITQCIVCCIAHLIASCCPPYCQQLFRVVRIMLSLYCTLYFHFPLGIWKQWKLECFLIKNNKWLSPAVNVRRRNTFWYFGTVSCYRTECHFNGNRFPMLITHPLSSDARFPFQSIHTWYTVYRVKHNIKGRDTIENKEWTTMCQRVASKAAKKVQSQDRKWNLRGKMMRKRQRGQRRGGSRDGCMGITKWGVSTLQLQESLRTARWKQGHLNAPALFVCLFVAWIVVVSVS